MGMAMLFESSGFEGVIFQSSICSSGRLNGVIKGSQYNCAWFVHSIFSEALGRLWLTRFLAGVIKLIMKKAQVLRDWFLFFSKMYEVLTVHLPRGVGARVEVEQPPPPWKAFCYYRKTALNLGSVAKENFLKKLVTWHIWRPAWRRSSKWFGFNDPWCTSKWYQNERRICQAKDNQPNCKMSWYTNKMQRENVQVFGKMHCKIETRPSNRRS